MKDKPKGIVGVTEQAVENPITRAVVQGFASGAAAPFAAPFFKSFTLMAATYSVKTRAIPLTAPEVMGKTLQDPKGLWHMTKVLAPRLGLSAVRAPIIEGCLEEQAGDERNKRFTTGEKMTAAGIGALGETLTSGVLESVEVRRCLGRPFEGLGAEFRFLTVVGMRNIATAMPVAFALAAIHERHGNSITPEEQKSVGANIGDAVWQGFALGAITTPVQDAAVKIRNGEKMADVLRHMGRELSSFGAFKTALPKALLRGAAIAPIGAAVVAAAEGLKALREHRNTINDVRK